LLGRSGRLLVLRFGGEQRLGCRGRRRDRRVDLGQELAINAVLLP
jgi:hypothetical protein